MVCQKLDEKIVCSLPCFSIRCPSTNLWYSLVRLCCLSFSARSSSESSVKGFRTDFLLRLRYGGVKLGRPGESGVSSSSSDEVFPTITSAKKIIFFQTFAGKSFSEALILGSTNPQYDKRLFIDLPVLYMKKHKLGICCVHKLFFCFVLTFKTIHVHNMFWGCSFH